MQHRKTKKYTYLSALCFALMQNTYAQSENCLDTGEIKITYPQGGNSLHDRKSLSIENVGTEIAPQYYIHEYDIADDGTKINKQTLCRDAKLSSRPPNKLRDYITCIYENTDDSSDTENYRKLFQLSILLAKNEPSQNAMSACKQIIMSRYKAPSNRLNELCDESGNTWSCVYGWRINRAASTLYINEENQLLIDLVFFGEDALAEIREGSGSGTGGRPKN